MANLNLQGALKKDPVQCIQHPSDKQRDEMVGEEAIHHKKQTAYKVQRIHRRERNVDMKEQKSK